jgi:hypothetical protein
MRLAGVSSKVRRCDGPIGIRSRVGSGAVPNIGSQCGGTAQVTVIYKLVVVDELNGLKTWKGPPLKAI